MKHKPERTVITIETFQRTTIHSGRRVKIVQCERCAADAPSETVAHLQTADRENLTLTEASSKKILGCRHSLAAKE